jgi:ribosomal protein S27E
MRWIEGFPDKDMYKEVPSSSVPCQGCGRRWFYYIDIPFGEYRIKCPICNHILHVRVKEKG